MKKKAALIFELMPEVKTKSNEEMREDIKLRLNKQVQPVIPWMKRIIEVIVWSEPQLQTNAKNGRENTFPFLLSPLPFFPN